MDHRGFLKVLGSTAAAMAVPSGVIMLDEPLTKVLKYRDWVRDMGDFYQVLVPEGRTIDKEIFDKPVLLGLMNRASMTNCRIDGLLNVYAASGFTLNNCLVDGSKYASTAERNGIIHLASGRLGSINNCHIVSSDLNPGVSLPREAVEILQASNRVQHNSTHT